MHKGHMVIDMQYGSTGKGLLAGYLAKRQDYDTVVCSFATNAGHTYKDKERGIDIMTQQLPTGITSPTVRRVLLGPGALIHPETFLNEVQRYSVDHDYLTGKQIMIHPHAAVVLDRHAEAEVELGLTKIGSTAKGVGAAMMERIARGAAGTPNVASHCLELSPWVVSAEAYRDALDKTENILIEGAQGFGLSMYHGFYPYTTSRDVTPWQIAADCGLPFKWAPYIDIYGTARTLPIRVNNRDGSSGPYYSDQKELDWESLGLDPELTTVTKLKRRIFSFSRDQMSEAIWHCGQYYRTRVFLNFANYLTREEVIDIMSMIEERKPLHWNPPEVSFVGTGPDDADVLTRDQWLGVINDRRRA